MPLNDRRTALVTGASSCIGFQLAHEAAQNGTSACDHGTCEADLHAFAKSSPLNVTIRVSARDFEQSDATQEIFDELQSSGHGGGHSCR